MKVKAMKRLSDEASPKIAASTLQRFDPLTITISNRHRVRKLNVRLLEEITVAVLKELKIEPAELGVVLMSARDMALLNEEFLGHEGPTDVITFDYGGTESGIGNPELPLHGEIFICVEEAERQAKQFGTDWRSEVVRYVIHGILHLMGHDDMQPAARKKMKRLEGQQLVKISRRFALSKL
jgi:probable rRNA maturation factor